MNVLENFKSQDPLDPQVSHTENMDAQKLEKTDKQRSAETKELDPKEKMRMMQESFQRALDAHARKVSLAQKDAQTTEEKAKAINKTMDEVFNPISVVHVENTQTRKRIPTMSSQSGEVADAAKLDESREKITSAESVEKQAKQKGGQA
jgi:hypothetical protein